MLQKRGWVILVVTIITVLSAAVFSKIQTPVYRATIYLNVWPARPDYGLQQTTKGLMRNYANNIKSRNTMMEVINRAQLDITPEQLQGKVRVSSIESDFLIQIDVDDYDSHIAQMIAQTTAEVFVEDMTAYMVNRTRPTASTFPWWTTPCPACCTSPRSRST
jgi:capsular polysaccharide biosynthesis protein